jgi:hypothetical protein
MSSSPNGRVIDEGLQALSDENAELAMSLSTMILVRACIVQNMHEEMSEVFDPAEPRVMSIGFA